jgi:hypothetical protein
MTTTSPAPAAASAGGGGGGATEAAAAAAEIGSGSSNSNRISATFMTTAVLSVTSIALAAVALWRLTLTRRGRGGGSCRGVGCPTLLIDGLLVGVAVVAVALQLHVLRASGAKMSETFMNTVSEHFADATATNQSSQTQSAAQKQTQAQAQSAAQKQTQAQTLSSAQKQTQSAQAQTLSSAQDQHAPQAGAAEDEQLPTAVTGGLTVYVSAFSSQCYTPGSKVLRNIAPERRLEGAVCSATNDAASADLLFAATPAFSPTMGFSLGANVLSGPNSHRLGINGETAFSAFMLCRFIGDVPAAVGSSALLLQLFANTDTNNGLQISASGAGARADDSTLRLKLQVRVGSAAAKTCRLQGSSDDFVTVDTARSYLLAFVKDYNKYSVSMTDVGAPTLQRQVLLSAQFEAPDGLLLSNRDMAINGRANWNANLLAFGLYARALTEMDLATLAAHYGALLKASDPHYAELSSKAAEAGKLRSCPYDAATCAACAGVTDWSNNNTIMSTAGTPCLQAINAFCSRNPTHSHCSCWDMNNPQFDGSCKAYRSIFAGTACAAAAAAQPAATNGSVSLSDNNLETLARMLTTMQAARAPPPPVATAAVGGAASHLRGGTCGARRHDDGGSRQHDNLHAQRRNHHPDHHRHHDRREDGGKDVGKSSGFWSWLIGA